MDLKTCTGCRLQKDISSFRTIKYRGTLSARCITCAKKERLAYYYSHKEAMQASAKAWATRNKESRSVYMKEWEEKNKEARDEYRASYYEDCKEYILARGRDWRAKNSSVHRELVKTWKRNNPDKAAELKQRRRARILKSPGTITARDLKDARETSCGLCAYCLRLFSKLEIDHVIPLSRDGHHSPDNIITACRRCNLIKSDHGPLYMVNGADGRHPWI